MKKVSWHGGLVDGLGTGGGLKGCVVYAGICKRKWKCSRDRGSEASLRRVGID